MNEESYSSGESLYWLGRLKPQRALNRITSRVMLKAHHGIQLP